MSPKTGYPLRSRQFTQESCEALMRAPRNPKALLVNINGVTLQPDTQGTPCHPGMNDVVVMNRPMTPEESAAWKKQLEDSGALGPGTSASPQPAR